MTTAPVVKPNQPAPPASRRRLIWVYGDGRSVSRVARHFNATATIVVAPDVKTPATSEDHPSIVLTVKPDGRWTVERRPPGIRVDPILLASGHIDVEG